VFLIAQGIAATFNMIPAALADASTSTTTSPSNYGFPGFLFLLIAYLSRRREIGGWLMLYYIGLYLGGIVSVVLIATTISNLAPAEWATVPAWKYLLAVLSTFLPIGALVAEIIIGTRLLSKRTPEMLGALRRVMLVFLAATALAFAIDATVFTADRTAAALDIYSLIVGCIWLAYFYRSTRVQAVFVTHSWTHLRSQDVATTAAELKYVKKRAWITFVVIVALFTILGLAIGSLRGLLVGAVSGLFWGAIGGYAARNMSLGKARRERIAANAVTPDTLTLEKSPPRVSRNYDDLS
jgi:hypothetical protein